MGSGASTQNEVLQTSLGLPTAVLSEFARYEQECEKIGFPPAKIYELLSAKYEEYLEYKKEHPKRHEEFKCMESKGWSRKAHKFDTIDAQMDASDIMNIILSADNSHFRPETEEDKKNRDLLMHDMAVRLKEINRLELGHRIDNHSTDLVNDLFLNTNATSSYTNLKDFGYDCETNDYSSLKTQDCSVTTTSTIRNESDKTLTPSPAGGKSRLRFSFMDAAATCVNTLSEQKRFSCNICRIRFESSSLLQSHINHSELHAANLMQKELNEAADYRKNKQEMKFKAATVTKLQDGFKKSATLRCLHNTEYSLRYKLLWQKAYEHVQMALLKTKFEKLTARMVFIPNDVQLMYSGDKVFYRPGNTVTVHVCMYLHTNTHCIEIVLDLLNINNMSVTASAQQQQQSSTHNNSTSTQYFIPLPRIYLNHNTVLGCVMGTQKEQTGLLTNVHNSTNENAHKFDATFYHSKSVNLCMDKVMSSFILSHLKMVKAPKKPHGLKKQKTANDVRSDASHVKGNMHSSSEMKTSLTQSTSMVQLSEIDTNANAASTTSTTDIATVTTPSRTHHHTPKDFMQHAKAEMRLLNNSNNQHHSTESPRDIQSVVTQLLEDKVYLDILEHINDYTVFFDDSNQKTAKTQTATPLLGCAPEGLQPIASLCVDQTNIFYEPAQNK